MCEAAVADAPDDQTWADNLHQAAREQFESVLGFGVQMIEHAPDFTVTRARSYGDGKLRGLELTREEAERLGPKLFQATYFSRTPTMMMSALFERFGHSAREVLARYLAFDMGGVSARVMPGHVGAFFWSLDHRYTLRSQEQRLLDGFSFHLEVGLRLRMANPTPAVLTPDGTVLESSVPVDREGLWAALTTGRLSLAARGHGPTRHYLAIDTPLASRARRCLTHDEVSVLEGCAAGASAKAQAYELNVSPSAVSRRLATASFKLGLSHPLDAVRLAGGLLRRTAPPMGSLTSAERDVLTLLQQGLSNRDIACERERSTRTVANQVASVLRKTGLGNRRALIAAQRCSAAAA